MKRILLILSIIAISTMLFAQSSTSDLYKQWMIEDINNEKFEKAANEITHVEDWTFNSSDEKAYVDINKALSFAQYLSSIGISKSLGDSLLMYVAKDSYISFLYMYSEGKYSESIPYLELELQIRKEVLGEFHHDYVTSVGYLGVIYDKMGDYENAEKYYLKALEIQKKLTGVIHPDYAACLHNISHLYYDMGDYSKAMKYGFQAHELFKNLLGENHLDYAVSLNMLGNLYQSMGDYANAEKCYIQSLNIKTSNNDVDEASYTNSFSCLGTLYSDMGDYKKAEIYYLKALGLKYKDSDPEYNGTLVGNLGNLYSSMGDYSSAEKFLLQAVDIHRNILGENHPDYAISLGNLGSLYHTMGNYEKAEECGLKALNIIKKNNPYYATALNNLGLVYQSIGHYDRAEKYYLQALEMTKTTLGENHPVYATLLNNIGGLYEKIGNYAKAEKYNLLSLEIRKLVLGEAHPEYAASLNNIGLFYSNIGNYANAEPYFRKAQNISHDLFLHSLDFMSENQREFYWRIIRIDYEYGYFVFTYRYHVFHPEISSWAYNNELFTKGLLLASSENVRRSILESGDVRLINQWNELTTKKQQIITFEERDPQSKYLEELRSEAERLEKEITKSSAAFRLSKELWNVTWDSVRNHLDKNQVAIEYMVVPLSADSTMYCALLLRNNSQYPELIPIFEEKELLSLINISNDNFINTYRYNNNGKLLTEKVWGKIFHYIKQGETIYFAPSGLLHQLAMESLPYDDNHTMADAYSLIRLSSTRELVLNKSKDTHSTASLYGGIQYTMDTTAIARESKKYPDIAANREGDNIDRGSIDPLPGTKEEVENINQMLHDNNLSVNLYTSTAANEESFKALSGKHHNILHIATHGFYWSDSTAQKKDYFSQRMLMMDGKMPVLPTIDPLNRCGLLFAGANTALSGHSADLPEGVQDGILTAKEISLLDLRDADLVVLSACETGKGEITGEGVFGLQRAFKQAGAQTLVMSLWKVDDKATQLLMTEFYRNWIAYHQSKREAFRNAQNTVRSKYKEPVYWAGFIMLD